MCIHMGTEEVLAKAKNIKDVQTPRKNTVDGSFSKNMVRYMKGPFSWKVNVWLMRGREGMETLVSLMAATINFHSSNFPKFVPIGMT